MILPKFFDKIRNKVINFELNKAKRLIK